MPLLALFGHAVAVGGGPLSGVKPTSRLRPPTSEFDPSPTSAVIPLAAIFCKDVVGSKAANATGLSISKSMLPRADQDDRMRRREFLQFAGFVAIAAAKPLVAGAEQARQRRRVGVPHEYGKDGGRGNDSSRVASNLPRGCTVSARQAATRHSHTRTLFHPGTGCPQSD
jgi:hypothetical protein